MGTYNSAIITDDGHDLIAEAIAEGGTVQFVSAKTSSYAYPAGTNFAGLTELQDIKQSVSPFSAQVFNDTVVQISSRFDNSEVLQAYMIQTIGLYAKIGAAAEVLFAVVQAVNPDQMPTQSAVSPSAFIYNIQITVQSASSLAVTVNPAGTATIQDIFDLDSKKVDVSGGDISQTIIETLEESENIQFPLPEAGEESKGFLGKVRKFISDFRNWNTGVCLIGQIVNNCVTDNPQLPLSAAQGKVLMDLYTVLNAKLTEKSVVSIYAIPDRDGVSTQPDFIATGFHNVTQYSNGQYIYSIQAFVYPTSLTDRVIGNIPVQYIHINQDVYNYCYDMTGNRFLLIRITPSGVVRLETLDGTEISKSEIRVRGSIVL